MRERKPPPITRSVCFPVDMLPLVDEVEADFKNLSKFLRLSIDTYLAAKGIKKGKQASLDGIGEALLKAQVEQDRALAVVHASRAERTEKRLEDIARETQQRAASGAATVKFETADELVQAYRDRIPIGARYWGEGNWTNVAKSHNIFPGDVLAAVARHSSQSQLPAKAARSRKSKSTGNAPHRDRLGGA